MNPWEILGIEWTDDLRVVKKAYSRLIRQYNPEENPQGFQRVREAYEMIISNFAFQKTSEQLPKTQNSETISGNQEAYIEEIEHSKDDNVSNSGAFSPITNQQQHITDAINLLNLTKNLLEKEPDRNLPQKWIEIFKNECLWNIETKNCYSINLFQYLTQLRLESYIFLPKSVWRVIEENLNWRTQEISLSRIFAPEQLDSVLDPVRAAFGQAESSQNYDTETRESKKTGHRYPVPAIIALLFLLMKIAGTFKSPSSHQTYYYPAGGNRLESIDYINNKKLQLTGKPGYTFEGNALRKIDPKQYSETNNSHRYFQFPDSAFIYKDSMEYKKDSIRKNN